MPFDTLTVTAVAVQVKDKPDREHCVATANVVLNDQFLIRKLRLIDGVNGFFIAYPKDADDAYGLACMPQTRELRERIETCVIKEYNAST